MKLCTSLNVTIAIGCRCKNDIWNKNKATPWTMRLRLSARHTLIDPERGLLLDAAWRVTDHQAEEVCGPDSSFSLRPPEKPEARPASLHEPSYLSSPGSEETTEKQFWLHEIRKWHTVTRSSTAPLSSRHYSVDITRCLDVSFQGFKSRLSWRDSGW